MAITCMPVVLWTLRPPSVQPASSLLWLTITRVTSSSASGKMRLSFAGNRTFFSMSFATSDAEFAILSAASATWSMPLIASASSRRLAPRTLWILA